MNVAILSSRPGWHARDLSRAFRESGHSVEIVGVQAMRAAIGEEPRVVAPPPEVGSTTFSDLSSLDAVVVRTIPIGSLEQIIFRVDAIHRLERLGVRVVNPARVIERTVDKYYTSALLEEAGIPTPRTIVAEQREDAIEAFRRLGDVIVKPLFGSNGRGIVRITDEEIAHRVFRALEVERAVYYIQETIEHPGRDLRVFVVGGRVIAAIWRVADGWRTNVSRGGRPEPADLTPEWIDLALRAAEAVGAQYAGVDLLPSPGGGTYVLEVNGSPGWRALQPTADVDIARAIVHHVTELVGESRQADPLDVLSGDRS
jgi:RimK family alpha-L-glutamate ligase